jgi:hypothetical protein
VLFHPAVIERIEKGNDVVPSLVYPGGNGLLIGLAGLLEGVVDAVKATECRRPVALCLRS